MDNKRMIVHTMGKELSATFTKQSIISLPTAASELRSLNIKSFSTEVIERKKGLIVKIQSQLTVNYFQSESSSIKVIDRSLTQLCFVPTLIRSSQTIYQTKIMSDSVLSASLTTANQILLKPNIIIRVTMLIKDVLQLRDLSYFDNAVHVFISEDGDLSIPRIGTIKVEVN